MRLAAGTRLGPYEILSPLGAGGMGEVYRARDRKLDRDVAVKVLPASVAGDPEALARFEREAKAVAALSHPNILAIFDFGSQDGVAYAVTELLEGETLRARLESGPIPQRDAIDYGLQIARGLSAAHERGVVHRDLKPENLFVSKDGHLKILDFGLAKRGAKLAPEEETSAPTQSGHTEPGTVMGTVGYMSPEQVRGLAVDHRTDIFSFGAVLYELLSGERAFRKDTAADTMSAILNEHPPQLTQRGRNVSVGLDHVVEHCLEKDRDKRFQSARDIVFAVGEASGPVTSMVQPSVSHRRWWIAAAIVVVAAVVGLLVARRFAKPAVPTVKRVAVLPFENLGSPEDEYFADGMADAVRGKLTSLSGIEVIARDSSNPYKGTLKSPEQIARELDSRYLLKATVRWQKAEGASRVQVSPELVEVGESKVPASKWQQPFDASMTDVFQVQSQIAEKVAAALGVALSGGERAELRGTPTSSLAAYDIFLKADKARKTSGLTEARKAQGLYEEAVALDPGFAEAWAGLALVCSSLYDLGPTPDLGERASRAAERALALAPASPLVHLAQGYYRYQVLYEWQPALEEFTAGLRIAPGDAELLGARGLAEAGLGRWAAAERSMREGARLDPRSAEVRSMLAGILMMQRRPAEARTLVEQALALAPSDIGFIEQLAMTYLQEGNLSSARRLIGQAHEVELTKLVAFFATMLDLAWVLDSAQLELLTRLSPAAFGDDRKTWALCLAQAYALMGDAERQRSFADIARRDYEEALRSAPRDAMGHALFGLTLAYLGRKEKAIEEGQRALGLTPMTKDVWGNTYYQMVLARTYTLVGEPDRAIDTLELLLGVPSMLTPAWLRIDPNFDALRSNPRFQKLIAEK